MRCIPGATTNAYCRQCNAKGAVVGYSSPMVQLTCPACGYRWRTISAICVKCKTPSGLTEATDCIKCTKDKGGERKNGETKETNRGLFSASM